MTYQSAPGIPKNTPSFKSANKIIETVAIYYNVCPFFRADTIKKRNRKREIVLARQTAMLLIRKQTPLSLKSIGELFGKDHTTVIHSIQTLKDLMSVDNQVAEDITFINNQLNN